MFVLYVYIQNVYRYHHSVPQPTFAKCENYNKYMTLGLGLTS